jgi:hypothetical protein
MVWACVILARSRSFALSCSTAADRNNMTPGDAAQHTVPVGRIASRTAY